MMMITSRKDQAPSFPLKPEPGEKHLRYLDHVKNNICDGDEKRFSYLICWMARAVQKPDEPGEVAIVVCGGQGTGKTLFADVFGSLFGPHYWAVDAKAVNGRFNTQLRDCVVMLAEDVFSARDRRIERIVKSLIKERVITIEAKGSDPEVLNNKLHVILTSAEYVVTASSDERRFFVLDVAKPPRGNQTDFAAIMRDLADGGFANLLYMLQSMDLSGFNPRDMPVRTAS